ncbi:MAG: PH domain-containing protein [Bacteroidales bacterium]|nr:PH domain-containing protein [Bacteroidales bacterium]
MKKVYRSRISVLLVGFILAVLIPAVVPMVKHSITSGLVTIGGVFVFILLLLSGIRYIICNNKIYIKVWMFSCGSIEISNISSVKRSYNPLSSPAASLKRLRIYLIGGSVFSYILISPVREQEFIQELKSLNPNIVINVPDKKGLWRIQDWDI